MEDNKTTDDYIEIIDATDTPTSTILPSEEPPKKDKKFSTYDIVRYSILVIAIGVFLFSGYKLISIYANYHKGDVEYKKVENEVFVDNKVEEDLPPVQVDEANEIIVEEVVKKGYKFLNYDHAALKAINSEAQGYLDIPAIDITVPIALGPDNEKYLNHAITGAYHSYGCPFIDFRQKDGLKAKNPIIYGHAMKNGAMFGKLTYYLKQDFYNEEGNQYIYVYTEDGVHIYQIFSVYICNAFDQSTYTFEYDTQEAYASYVANVKSKARYSTGVPVTGNDDIITLSTCYDDKELRLVVHAKKL